MRGGKERNRGKGKAIMQEKKRERGKKFKKGRLTLVDALQEGNAE